MEATNFTQENTLLFVHLFLLLIDFFCSTIEIQLGSDGNNEIEEKTTSYPIFIQSLIIMTFA